MKLIKKQAIDLSIELWEWLAKTGKEKRAWPERSKYWGEDEARFCPLCDYVNQRHPRIGCVGCPLGSCHEHGFGLWVDATTIKAHKKCATLFLEQLRELLPHRVSV